MIDPRMSFTCKEGSRRIGLLRRSGGYVVFTLTSTGEDHSQPITYETIDIDTEEKFDKLWAFLKGLKPLLPD